MQSNGFEQGLKLYYEQWLATLPDEDDPALAHVFSKRFERRMARLLVQQGKPYYPMVNRAWKRALLAVVITLLLMLAAMSVSAVRERIVSFIVRVYEKFSTVVLKPEVFDGIVFAQSFAITDLPDGFELNSIKRFELFTQYVYCHPGGDQLILLQHLPYGTLFEINTEDTALEEVPLEGFSGRYYRSKEHGNLLWYSNGFAFLLSGDLDRDSLAQIALSVQPEK